MKVKKLLLSLPLVFIASCSQEAEEARVAEGLSTSTENSASIETTATSIPTSNFNENKNAYFGNLHVHTSWSFDGFTNGSVTEPEDAYRWAKGESIPGGGSGAELQIKQPLDWYAVSDHAEWMGMFKMMDDPTSALSELDFAKRVTSDDPAVSFQAFADFLYDFSTGGGMANEPLLSDPEIMKSVWKKIIDTADSYNDPGQFTTFPAFEWSSNPNTRNLHRVVVFQNSENIPELAFSSLISEKPEDLWAWMDESRENGATLLAIPHNGNASDGLMFSLNDSNGEPISAAYSEIRMRNEPLYEISQIKGTSETHPALSSNDEFANFELWDYTLAATAERPTNRQGSYLRQALRDGLQFEGAGAGNPFKYGIIGDSDTHNSASSIEEDNYTGKFGMENDAEHRLEGIPGFAEANKTQVREFSSGGLAGVWAEENTREAIYNAMLRKETFGTSGTRMQLRMFASFDFDENMINASNWITTAYAKGVAMGGDLSGANGRSPVFIIHAIKEADGANLDRAQMVKGWLDENGDTHEIIYDVALADERTDGSISVGNSVNLDTATYTNDIGDVELISAWTDPDFDESQSAFYYLRVLEIPTPRWSTYDAVTLGLPIRTDLPATIQERAWSSPIWYTL